MAAGVVLGIDHLAINFNGEDAFRPHDEGEVFYDMLVVGHEIVGGAHGAR